MLIQGYSISAEIPSDPSFKDRFWYWSGASGRKYIHSIYSLDDCPPLPGAIYVGVRRDGQMRVAVAIGRFTPLWDGTIGNRNLASLQCLGVDEIHVHLLAKSQEASQSILGDLLDAFEQEGNEQVMHTSTSPDMALQQAVC